MRLLADTHVVLRWFSQSRKLTREQSRALEHSVQRAEQVGISCVSLIEMAVLYEEGKLTISKPIEEFLRDLEANPVFRIMPVTAEIAADVYALPGLRDPMDRTIAATARCHRLKLVTSDQRIIDSGLVPTIF